MLALVLIVYLFLPQLSVAAESYRDDIDNEEAEL